VRIAYDGDVTMLFNCIRLLEAAATFAGGWAKLVSGVTASTDCTVTYPEDKFVFLPESTAMLLVGEATLPDGGGVAGGAGGGPNGRDTTEISEYLEFGESGVILARLALVCR
jgi:hypothetical protein